MLMRCMIVDPFFHHPCLGPHCMSLLLRLAINLLAASSSFICLVKLSPRRRLPCAYCSPRLRQPPPAPPFLVPANSLHQDRRFLHQTHRLLLLLEKLELGGRARTTHAPWGGPNAHAPPSGCRSSVVHQVATKPCVHFTVLHQAHVAQPPSNLRHRGGQAAHAALPAVARFSSPQHHVCGGTVCELIHHPPRHTLDIQFLNKACCDPVTLRTPCISRRCRPTRAGRNTEERKRSAEWVEADVCESRRGAR